jgi:hypothetical protein
VPSTGSTVPSTGSTGSVTGPTLPNGNTAPSVPGQGTGPGPTLDVVTPTVPHSGFSGPLDIPQPGPRA